MSRIAICTAASLLPGLLLAQGVTVAVDAGDGRFDLWQVDDGSGDASPALSGVAFLDLRLGGYARMERLRLDRPRRVASPPSAPRVELPGGGSLYRTSRAGSTELLHVRADGGAATLISVPDTGGVPGMLDHVHVSGDGSLALVASPLEAGGDVFVLDLLGQAPPLCLTAEAAPLDVSPRSLRVSQVGAWFVAGGRLFRAWDVSGSPAQLVPLDLDADESVHPELALSEYGDVVVAVIEVTPLRRRLVHVGWSESYVAVTSVAGEYQTPCYDDPLGPWLVVSPDGSLVAFRGSQPGDVLLARRMGASAGPTPLTTASADFLGIDNIGVLGVANLAMMAFVEPHTLAFFVGELELEEEGQELEDAEMYAADFSDPESITFTNLTRTSGELVAPFESCGTLELEEVAFDPAGERMLFHGATGVEEHVLAAFRVRGPDADGVHALLSDQEEPPLLYAAGPHVLVVAGISEEPEDGDLAQSIHVLRALQPEQDDQLQLLFELPEGSLAERFAAPRHGSLASFVSSAGQGADVPYLIDLEHSLLARITKPGQSLEVSPAMAFSTGSTLYLGLGAPGGPYQFFAVDQAFGGRAGLRADPRALALPAAFGFPLAP